MLAEALTALAALAPGADVVSGCLDAAQRHFNTPPGLVHAIASVESGGNPRAVNSVNRNGTVDYGLMQVNSVHLPRLRGIGIDREHLLNPCINAFVGAQILARNLSETGGAVVAALSMYNTGRPDSVIGLNYAQKVLARWQSGGRLQWTAAMPGKSFAPSAQAVNVYRAPLMVASNSNPFAPRW